MQNVSVPVHSRLCLALVLGIAAAFVGVALQMRHLGTSGRAYGTAESLADGRLPVRVARTTAQLYSLWKESGYRGRRLVHLSRFLHFVEPEPPAATVEMTAFPVRTFDLLAHWEREVSAKNVLWLALRSGVVRRVDHVLPAAELDARRAGLDPRTPGVRFKGRRILTHELGSPRVLSDELPVTEEPVLFAVDASYFYTEEPAALLRRLRGSRLVSELVVLCRSDDNPDVGAAERERLDELARRLGVVF